MKKILTGIAAFVVLAMGGCQQHDDDFEFSGVVIDYELCTSLQDLGYAVELTSPEDIGGDYHASDGKVYKNVVVIYLANCMLHDRDSIGGRIYWDRAHSEADCNYHYRETTGDVPEACFSKLKVY